MGCSWEAAAANVISHRFIAAFAVAVSAVIIGISAHARALPAMLPAKLIARTLATVWCIHKKSAIAVAIAKALLTDIAKAIPAWPLEAKLSSNGVLPIFNI